MTAICARRFNNMIIRLICVAFVLCLTFVLPGYGNPYEAGLARAVKEENSKHGALSALALCNKLLSNDHSLGAIHLQRASILSRNLGRFCEAAEECKWLVERHPKVLSFRQGLAHCLMYCGEWQEAMSVCTKAVALFPHAGVLYAVRAELEFYLSQYAECLKDCETALKERYNNAKVYRLEADSYLALGELDQAERAYARAYALYPVNELESLRLQVEILHHQHRLAEAVRSLDVAVANSSRPDLVVPVQLDWLACKSLYPQLRERADNALARFPNQPQVLVAVGLAYERLRMQQAADCYQKAIALKPKEVNFRITFATYLFVIGQRNRALAYLKECGNEFQDQFTFYLAGVRLKERVGGENIPWQYICAQPLRTAAQHSARGCYILERTDPGKPLLIRAIEDFEAADKLSTPFLHLVYLYRCKILLARAERHEQQSIAAANAYVRRVPSYDSWRNRAGIFQFFGKFQESAADFKKCAQLRPFYLEPYLHGGSSFLRASQFDEAYSMLTKGLEIYPKEQSLLLLRAQALYLLGKQPEMLADIKTLRTLGTNVTPEDIRQKSLVMTKNLFNSVTLFAQTGDDHIIEHIKEATTALQHAPEKERFQRHMQLGQLYFRYGDYESAIEQFELANKLKPDHYGPSGRLAAAYFARGDKAKSQMYREAAIKLYAKASKNRHAEEPFGLY